MAQGAVEELLAGNVEMMRFYLNCEKRGEAYSGWTGRSDGYTGPTSGLEHSVIHGKLHEYGCLALRKKIVEAFPDLLKDERARDLEDQVQSLIKQLNEKDDLIRRLQEDLSDWKYGPGF